MVDVKCLSDYELHKHLKTLGFTPGPILPSTRKIYERKLVQLLASSPCESVMKRPRRLPGSEDSDDSEGALQDQVRGTSVGVSPTTTNASPTTTNAPRAAS
ncbi:rCG46494, isoform CRA_c [Rattus norvegicus]|uniref:RCG46494, isoform CRA_c n=1 Tax=Rattus norvegicus TaxID=10116 RepID=A6IC45_RAT|nr:LEM domain-containing protein 1 isoform X5 [Rattus norvegicus]EDM09803.1 rCG46494, isoform CRA_c [Rattus norvegicus]